MFVSYVIYVSFGFGDVIFFFAAINFLAENHNLGYLLLNSWQVGDVERYRLSPM